MFINWNKTIRIEVQKIKTTKSESYTIEREFLSQVTTTELVRRIVHSHINTNLKQEEENVEEQVK